MLSLFLYNLLRTDQKLDTSVLVTASDIVNLL